MRVRYAECDMQGYVFNAHYLTWFDVAFAEMLTDAAGRRYSEMVAEGIDVVVAECGIRYLAPARYDDELEVAVSTGKASTTTLTSRYQVTRDGESICEAWMRHVCFDLREQRKRPWPDELRAAFPHYRVEPVP
jgi:acyl-CoA thioester hydrolase